MFYHIFIRKEYIMKRIVRLTESDLTRIVKRVIKEQYHENIETPSDDDLRSKLDSYKKKMENFLRELKSSGTEIDKHRFLKQVQKETDQMYWDVYDNSDSEPEGFVELQMDLIKHFRKKLNESYRSRVVKRVISENEDDDFSEHQWKYREMNKYGINPHPKQLSGEWNYMNEYHKQILIRLIRDNKKRIDQLTKILETEENPNMVDLFQHELDLTMKSNEKLRDSLNSFDERNKK